MLIVIITVIFFLSQAFIFLIYIIKLEEYFLKRHTRFTRVLLAVKGYKFIISYIVIYLIPV